jgi:CBS domain containing-hemolysin-like protein
MSTLERIPVVGDTAEIEDGTLEVARMDGRRVDRVKFTPRPLPDGLDAAARRCRRALDAKGVAMSDWAGIAWLVVLLAFNAFFVGAEFAVISARRSQIEPLAERGSKTAKTALYAMEHATLMLATCQLGITICSLLILNVSEPAIHHLLEGPLGLTGWSEAVIGGVAFAIALVVVSYLHVVFGEMVPKNLAFSLPDRAVLLLATPLVWTSKLFYPIIAALNWIANHVVRLFRVEPKNEAASTFTLDEVATIVNQSRIEGVLDDASGAVTAAWSSPTRRRGTSPSRSSSS